MIGAINNVALQGMQNGFNDLQKNASQIASKDVMEGRGAQSRIESLVDLKANAQQVSASLKVLEVSDNLIGTLLDITA